MHIRKGDLVEVIAGDDRTRGKERRVAKVLRVIVDDKKVVVEGVNKVYKHVRPTQRNPKGGRLSKEMPISVSNVLLYCSNCQRGVRIGKRYAADGRKERYCKKCGAGLGPLSKGRAAYAAKT